MSGGRLIFLMCLAEVVGMAGFAAFPALLPTFLDEWKLSNTAAGWISGIFFAGYVGLVPVLVSLTDRLDPRRIYLASMVLTVAAALGFALLAEGFWSALVFRVLAGIGLAGTYMPGLKILSDRFACWPARSRPGSTGAGPSAWAPSAPWPPSLWCSR
jgi:MFS family permease